MASSNNPEADTRGPELSVVIPAHNEADNINRLVARTAKVLQSQVRFEVIVVDDASSDDTLAQLRALLPDYPCLRIGCHQVCSGQSAGLLSGISLARGVFIATMDGDGQNDPADIPRLLQCLRDDASLDMVAGWRQTRQDSAWRRLSSRLANAIRRRLLHDDTPDTGCGLKVFRRRSFMGIPAFDHMHRYLPALFIRAGGRVCSMPVSHHPRRHGRSHYGTLDRALAGLFDLLGMLWLIRRAPTAVVREIGENDEQ